MALEVTRRFDAPEGGQNASLSLSLLRKSTQAEKIDAAPAFVLLPGNPGNPGSGNCKNRQLASEKIDAAPAFVLLPLEQLLVGNTTMSRSYWNPSVN